MIAWITEHKIATAIAVILMLAFTGVWDDAPTPSPSPARQAEPAPPATLSEPSKADALTIAWNGMSSTQRAEVCYGFLNLPPADAYDAFAEGWGANPPTPGTFIEFFVTACAS